jgi:hypothetical protein
MHAAAMHHDREVVDLRQHIQAVSLLADPSAFLAARNAFLAGTREEVQAASPGWLSMQELLEAQDRIFGLGASAGPSAAILSRASKAEKVEMSMADPSEDTFSTCCPSDGMSPIRWEPSGKTPSGKMSEDSEEAVGPAVWSAGPYRPGTGRACATRAKVPAEKEGTASLARRLLRGSARSSNSFDRHAASLKANGALSQR